MYSHESRWLWANDGSDEEFIAALQHVSSQLKWQKANWFWRILGWSTNKTSFKVINIISTGVLGEFLKNSEIYEEMLRMDLFENVSFYYWKQQGCDGSLAFAVLIIDRHWQD